MGVKMTVFTGPSPNPNHNPNHNPIPKTLTISLNLTLSRVCLRNDLLCVEWDVKLYSLTHPNPLPPGMGRKLWSEVVSFGREWSVVTSVKP